MQRDNKPELADGAVLDFDGEEADLGVGGALGEVPVLEVDDLLRVAVRVAATVLDCMERRTTTLLKLALY